MILRKISKHIQRRFDFFQIYSKAKQCYFNYNNSLNSNSDSNGDSDINGNYDSKDNTYYSIYWFFLLYVSIDSGYWFNLLIQGKCST